MPERPTGQTMQSTLELPHLVIMWLGPAVIAEVAGAGSSLAAARPGGYRDGAEDATTVPSAAIATTAVTARSLWIGPGIAGTTSVPSGASRARPARLAGDAEHGSGRHAAAIALGQLPGVAPRGGVHLGLQLRTVHQLGYLEAEHERLDQHHDGERDHNVGGDQPPR